MVTLVRREVIRDRGWLNEDEFLDMVALGNLLPGSNPINLAVLIGMHARGWVGPGGPLLGAVGAGFPPRSRRRSGSERKTEFRSA